MEREREVDEATCWGWGCLVFVNITHRSGSKVGVKATERGVGRAACAAMREARSPPTLPPPRIGTPGSAKRCCVPTRIM